MDLSQQRRTPQSSPNPRGAGDSSTVDAAQVRVEDLTLEKKLEVLRKYNPADYYEETKYIDAQDSINSWCLGQIVQVDNKSVNVHFDGWSSRWDVWQKVTSWKIAPFRKNSRGYTGQNKVALRQNMTFSLDELQLQKQRVQRFIDNDLNGFGAFETTQYLRGQLFIYVDFLMQNSPYTEEQVDAINDFLYHVLRLIVTWLKKIPKLIPLYSQIKVNPDLFLIDENIAILQSAYELLDILKKLFCCCHRCIKYYIEYDKNPINFQQQVTQKFDHINFEGNRKNHEELDIEEIRDSITSRKGIVYGQFLNFINAFAEMGGFEAIVDFLKSETDNPDEKIPLEMFSLLTLPFRNCNEIFSPTFATSFVQSIKDLIVHRLRTMSEKELKEIDKETVGRMLLDVKDFFTLSMTDVDTAEIIEQNLLITALRFLRSTVLEKRLKGITEIKTMIERIEYAQKQAQFRNMQVDQRFRGNVDHDMMGVKAMKPPKWLTADAMRDWILNEKILDIVFGENTHLEIVKRSGCILKFLAKQSALPIETVDIIWKQQSKHEEMVRVIYTTIQELVPYIDSKIIDLFFQRIQSVPVAQFDDKFLDFLKDFTHKSLESHYEMKHNEGSIAESSAVPYEELINHKEKQVLQRIADNIQSSNQVNISDEPPYGLPILWELIQDKTPNISNEVMQSSMNAICEILKQNYSHPLRMAYLIKALDNICKGESLVQSIHISQQIISEYNQYDYNNDTSLSQKTVIVQINKQIELVNRVIQNIVNYHSQVREKVKGMAAQKKTIPEDVANFTFVGKHNHESYLKAQLEFLEFLIVNSNSAVTIGIQNIDTLWKIFVHSPNFSFDQTLFLKWINQHREENFQKKEYFLFDDDERKYFFTKILCNPTYLEKISYGQVKCFHKYFKVINKQEENLEVNKRRMKVINYDQLLGLETLWKIAIESDNEKARDESMDLLVDIHLKFDQGVPQQDLMRIWSNFIDQCMRNLDSENESLVSSTLQLISKFLDRYEGKKALKPEFKHSQFTNLQPLNITVMNRSDQSRKQVQCSYFQTIGFLRQKIAEAFEIQINEFNMFIKNQYFDADEDDDRYIKEIGLIQAVIIQANPNYNPKNHPKFQISDNQANYDKLFYLLSKENPTLIEATWDLLQKLPVNAKLQQEIKELSGVMENSKNWERILDPKSTNKLLYSLRIINNHVNNKKDQKSQQWRFKFVQMGGFNHLLKTFTNLDIQQIDTNLTLKCIELMIIILYDFIMNDKDLTKQVMDNKESVILKSINLIDLICDFQMTTEQKRGFSIEDLMKRIQQNKQKKNRYKSYMQGNKGMGGNTDNRQQQSQQEEEDDQESQEYNQAQSLMKQFQEDQKIVNTLFKFMFYTVFNQDPSSQILFLKYHNLEQFLIKSTITCENWMLRNEVLSRLKEILQSKNPNPQDQRALQEILAIMIFKVSGFTEKYEQRCQQFYDNVSSMIDGQSIQDFILLQGESEQMINALCNFIISREVREKNTQDQDNLLSGKMKILKSLLFKFPQYKQPAGQILTYHLLHDCLFEVPQGGTTKSQMQLSPPKCKSIFSRRVAVQLLAVLCRDCPANLIGVLDYMHKFNQNPSWRTNKDVDWNISLMEEKSSTGYVGIKNLGCICYMLSLFQQLFMISSFRNDLLSVKDPNFAKVEKEENMLYQLQTLFAGLLKSEKQYVNPKGFCHAFKDYDGQSINVVEQMDVDEFLNMLMDRLETAIKGTPQANTIAHHFGGKFADEKICKGCPHKYESTEPFLSFSIPVKNKKSIIEGLNAFVAGDMLEGDNAYQCEKCDKKVDALKRTCVKKLPRYMIIALKRFEFDYDKMVKVKVNDYCEFPMEFSMEPFTQEGLARREKYQQMVEEKGEENKDEIQMDPLKYPEEYYDYSLSGVVVHTGTADSGHYYSFVKDREHPESGKWYELNDHVVRDFDPADIPQECYGGEETYSGYNMVQMKSMKWRNAYLLFYERKSKDDFADDEEKEADKTDSINKEDVEMKSAQSQEVSILTDIEEKIAYENQKYWQNRFLFSNEYLEFVHDLSLNWNTSCLIPKQYLTKNNDFHITGFPMPKEYERDLSIPEPLDIKIPIAGEIAAELEERVFKFATQFYLTILQRASNKIFIPQMLNLLKGYINKNYNCAHWIISEFCNQKILEENLLQCGSKEMRKFVVGILYCAMLKVYPVEQEQLMLYWQSPQDADHNKTVIGNLALILMHNIFVVKKFVANSAQYFQLIARISSLGTRMREFLIKAKAIGRLMEFFFDDVSPHKEYFRDFTDINPLYKDKPDIGLPTEIDKKQMSQFQEILERRRMKNLMDAPPKYKYLIEAVSNCVRGFKNGEFRSPYALDEIPHEGLLSQERDLFIPESKFLKKVFAESKKNRSLKFVSQGYVHFTWTEKEGFNELLGVIQHGLNEYDFEDIRPYLMLTQYLLQSPGPENLADQRFELVIQTFLDTVKQNQQYYKFMEAIIEFVFKITSRIPRVKEWFAAKKNQWAWLAEWAQEQKFPVNTTDQNSLRVYKRRNNMQLHSQYLRSEFYKNQSVREARVKRMEALLQNSQPDLSSETDIDLVDLQDYKFIQGEVVEIYQKRVDKLQQVQVEQVLDEMIHVKYLNVQQQQDSQYQQQSNTSWMGCDTDKLMLNGTYKNQYKTKIINWYQEQQQRQRQEGSQGNQQQVRGNPNDMEYDMEGGGNQYGNGNNFDSEEDDGNSSGNDLYN